jgi:hypothetical protein
LSAQETTSTLIDLLRQLNQLKKIREGRKIIPIFITNIFPMKAVKLFAFLCCFSISVDSIAQSPKNIEAALGRSFKKIGYWEQQKHNDNELAGEDSLKKANERFQQKLKRYTVKYPFTFNLSFSRIKHLKVSTSADNNLRCYSWDDGSGGTQRYYKTTIQYKYGGRLFSVNEDENLLITGINIIKTNKNTYYLITDFGQGMSGYFLEGIRVWSIQNGHLNKNSKLFKTDSGFKNTIDYTYYSDDAFGGHLRYDKKTKEFYIPVTTDNEKLTGKSTAYKFTGQYFEKVKTQLGK